MTTAQDILNFLEVLAPGYMKMDWDNIGLLCGSKRKEIRSILVALDPFEGVCQEAVEMGVDMIITHHPLIFQPPKAVTDESELGRSIAILLRNDICAVNAHTNLDCAPGGVNDILASKLGLQNIQVLSPAGLTESGAPWGLLRCGNTETQTLAQFLCFVKNRLGCEGLRYVDGGKSVSKISVGGGSCADCLAEVADAGCDTFITADVKYNQFWQAKELGINLIDAGHFYTENPVVAALAEKLQTQFPEITVKISQSHRDCMKFY